jgi:hypothetical protein
VIKRHSSDFARTSYALTLQNVCICCSRHMLPSCLVVSTAQRSLLVRQELHLSLGWSECLPACRRLFRVSTTLATLVRSKYCHTLAPSTAPLSHSTSFHMPSMSGLSRPVCWKICEVSLRIRSSGQHPELCKGPEKKQICKSIELAMTVRIQWISSTEDGRVHVKELWVSVHKQRRYIRFNF